ncbi:MAG TPA: YfbM family protein [Luteibacter sp.]|uniref:YfbM family protein n=1 Tax=Luteibacter sp. TaxID=1886636 RepID=UPI002B7D99D5|nr:YfbM family protein [Luteibacter sp.]HVI56953.1 YfbM family protein [Luteibacter sp.]
MSMIGIFCRVSPVTAHHAMTDAASAERLFHSSGLDADHVLNVEKTWHAIHFVLNGQPWPNDGILSQVVFGGEPFGDDLGYGPARCVDPTTVNAIAEELRSIDSDAIVAAMDLSRLDEADIYPGGWLDEGDNGRRYIADHLRALCAFYAIAARNEEAVIAWLS